MAHSADTEQLMNDRQLGAPPMLDSTNAENSKLRRQRSSHSDEGHSNRPISIEITPGLNLVDLSRTPTDSFLQDEPQGLTIQDLDTEDNEEEVPAIHQANFDIPSPNSSSFPVQISVPVEPPLSTAPMAIPTKRSIRFRSRVRITSGVHRKHHSQDRTVPLRPNGLLSPSEGDTAVSSCSTSPSSSISAPIRFREDEATVSPKWGPLGQRVRLFVSQQREKAKQAQANRETHERETRRRYLLVYGTDASTARDFVGLPEHEHEREPLLGSPRTRSRKTPTSFGDDDDLDLYEVEAERDYQARLNHEIDVIFGKWPGRLLNRHWWWWQIKPIVCCSYVEDWETEY
ncbi:hypothetical protein F5050DRAFT_1808249 [Lentinula boryana]|uniref:Uncharacterized protein n=1 Tax=Lentinula boryana TaxID=40481 RepID=A0ABQ8QBK6_9AGAR|nr:hypothetical protein F5050DRAFT_1808249 [Lentinula boryana]